MVTLNAFRKPSWLMEEVGERVEQEEVTQNSFSSLLVEEAFSFFRERVLWMLPLLMLKRFYLSKKESFRSSLAEFEEEGTLLPLPKPFQQSYEATSDYSRKEGCK